MTDWHLLVAIATSTSLHAVLEPSNLMRKLRRLDIAIKTGKIEALPLKGIDTRAKSYAFGLSIIGVFSLIAYICARLVDPGVLASIKYSIVVVLVAEIILMMRLDRYHVEIEKITRSQAK
jgi:hypothetical protein